MRKLITLLGSLGTIIPISLSTISCSSREPWVETLDRPEPIYAIKKTGYVNFTEDKIDINKFNYTYDLIDEINFYFNECGYNVDDMEWSVVRNKMLLSKGLDDNLLQNGTYTFTITNKLNDNDKIIVQQKITNSKKLDDMIKNTDLGAISDIRIKTILMKVIFNNLNLISSINDIADGMLNEENFEINNNQITLKFGDFDKNDRDKFYGELVLTYKIEKFVPEWDGQKTIEDMSTFFGGKTQTNLDTLKSIKRFDIFTQFITRNFSNRLNYLPVLVNDLDVENMVIKKIDGTDNEYEAMLNAVSAPENGYTQYLIGSIKLTFTYYGEFEG
ncbi:hypothetical protein SCHIN_v1c01750 [Spiroplasma chinense]|uniref:Lipoprotein n=1 Tax=Spiroplasma chinense TaxID=216932 RepID=A0A5B9Y3N6_9MOLU|nr:hypothetical protein [Spiroplasma chinense]QEH61373.1 hypothetical protein SCHIN_v1c01750 [Spiroplasma chinense]